MDILLEPKGAHLQVGSEEIPLGYSYEDTILRGPIGPKGESVDITGSDSPIEGDIFLQGDLNIGNPGDNPNGEPDFSKAPFSLYATEENYGVRNAATFTSDLELLDFTLNSPFHQGDYSVLGISNTIHPETEGTTDSGVAEMYGINIFLDTPTEMDGYGVEAAFSGHYDTIAGFATRTFFDAGGSANKAYGFLQEGGNMHNTFEGTVSIGTDVDDTSSPGAALTVQADGTLLDLQDSGGNSGLTYDGESLEVADNLVINNGGIQYRRSDESVVDVMTPNDSGGLKLQVPDGRAFIDMDSVSRITYNVAGIRNHKFKRDGNTVFEIGGNTNVYNDLDVIGGTATVQAASGQTDPLLRLNDETGSTQMIAKTGGGNTAKVCLSNPGYYGVKDSSGSEIRLFGLSEHDNVYIGALDGTAKTNQINLRADGSDVANFKSKGFTVKSGKKAFNRGGLFVEGEPSYPNDSDATLWVRAKNDQTIPLTRYTVDGGGTLFTESIEGDRKYHQPGKGVILTSPDGNTTKRVYLDNNGTLQTEAV